MVVERAIPVLGVADATLLDHADLPQRPLLGRIVRRGVGLHAVQCGVAAGEMVDEQGLGDGAVSVPPVLGEQGDADGGAGAAG